MQVFQIRILWDKQSQKKTLQYLLHTIVVRDWKEKLLLFSISQKVTGL